MNLPSYAPSTKIGTLPTAPATRFLRTLWLSAIVIVVVGSLLPANSAPMRSLNSRSATSWSTSELMPFWRFCQPFTSSDGSSSPRRLGQLLGVGLEFGQLFTGWRDFEVGDMIADAVGVCFGVAAGIPIR